MFKPVSMLEVKAVILEEDERIVLCELGAMGLLHLTRTRAGPDTAPLEPHDHSQRILLCDQLLARCTKLELMLPTPDKTLSSHIIKTSLSASTETLESMEITLGRFEEQSIHMDDQLRNLHRQWNECDAACDRVSGYRDLDMPMDHLDRFSRLHFIIGHIAEEQLNALQRDIGSKAILIPLPLDDKGRAPVIIMTSPTRQTVMSDMLRGYDFVPTGLPPTEGLTADAYFARQRNEQERITTELQQVDAHRRSLSAEVTGVLPMIQHRLALERRLLEASGHFPRTGTTLLLTGWIPATQARLFEQRLTAITHGHCFIQTTVPTATETDRVPVLLEHPGWLHPFQTITTAFGLPEYRDLEPTLFVAVSYVVMFGMMFGDAGQGAILAFVGWCLLHVRRTAMLRDVGQVLVLTGFSSIAFGVIYGSYFGIPALKEYALWRDPLEGNPLHLMLAAVILGATIISTGLILNIINRFRKGDVLEGWLGRFGIMGLLFYWSALVVFANVTGLKSHTIPVSMASLLLILPLLGWMLKGPIEAIRHRNRAEDASGGVVVLVAEALIGTVDGITGFLANTTSFVRLAAYSMSHTALLMAVFTVASLLKEMMPLGGLWALLVIILGNTIAIILEGIIAAVQALRLEYYEFFGKFFTGTGRPFTPFTLDQS